MDEYNNNQQGYQPYQPQQPQQPQQPDYAQQYQQSQQAPDYAQQYQQSQQQYQPQQPDYSQQYQPQPDYTQQQYQQPQPDYSQQYQPYQPQDYTQQGYNNQTQPAGAAPTGKAKTFGLISMILGIVSVCFSCCWGGGLLFGVAAIILSVVGKKQQPEADHKQGKIGLILGAIGAGISVIAFIIEIVIIVANSGSSYYALML